MKRTWLAIAMVVALALAAGAAWFVQRPTSYDDRDWSPVATTQPQVEAVWEPTVEQLEMLDAADPCALLRRIDPTVEEVAAYGPNGCKTLPDWDQLRVEVADAGTELVYGSASSFAYYGTELDAAGFTAWEIDAQQGEGHCAVFVPAGTEVGLLVRARRGSLCGTLPDRVASTIRAWRADPAALSRSEAKLPSAALPFTPTGETTLRGSGACADLRDQWARQCAEATERTVPQDPVDLIREGEADPEVVCSAALEVAGRTELDAAVRAVTADDDSHRWCVLLVGDREAEVFIRASRAALDTSAPATIGGHAAHQAAFGVPGYEIALAEPVDRGQLVIRFSSDGQELEEPEWGPRLAEELATTLLG